MYNRSLLLELFVEIDEAIRRIERRFTDIHSPDNFTRDDNGLDRLDGISMMLISISENIKRIEKAAGTDFSIAILTSRGLASKASGISWLMITST